MVFSCELAGEIVCQNWYLRQNRGKVGGVGRRLFGAQCSLEPISLRVETSHRFES